MPEIDNAKLREIYTTMVRIRAFEERILVEYRKGKLPGFMHSSIGQEAIPAAVCAFLREDDYILTTHRGHGDITAKGARFDRMMAELYSKVTGYCKGKGGSLHIAAVDRNIIGATGIVADGIPIAAGVARGCNGRGTSASPPAPVSPGRAHQYSRLIPQPPPSNHLFRLNQKGHHPTPYYSVVPMAYIYYI